jgi:hypothetical protein
MPWGNPVVGSTILRRPAIQSPNFVSGSTGWALFQDGTAQLNELTIIVQNTGVAILIYAGTAGPGTLIGSWSGAGTATTDQYGNIVPAGLYAVQGQLQGTSITNASIVSSILTNPAITGGTIAGASITGGTIVETAITFDNTGGTLLVYTTTTTTSTFSTAGLATFTGPAGVTSAKIECWGADAGAGGGSSAQGGEGGGAGEYAQEPNYPIVPGQVYNVQVGSGGTGGATGHAGSAGSDSLFDNAGIAAQGGQAGVSFVGGDGGSYGTATVNHPGGNGGGNGSQSTGGCGGGGRAGSTGAGGNGSTSSSSSGAAGGAAGSGTGGHVGGTGGNNAANGNTGGGGGGCGASTSATTGSNTYRLSASETFLGSDGSPANSQRGSGTMYQGGETASGGSVNGTMKSMGIISGNPSSDLSGVTIDSVYIRLEMLHSWYNAGATVYLGYTNNTSIPSTYGGSSTSVLSWNQAPGSPVTTNLTNHGFSSALQSGSARAIILGPGSGSFNLQNYCYFYGEGGDNAQNPLITVNWHTGAAPVTAGNGADGVVKVTYVSSSTLELAISPSSGTDANSNAYGAGLTGVVQAFRPASSPTAVETWHSISLTGGPAGITGYIRIKKIAESTLVILDMEISFTTLVAQSSTTVGNLPSGYYPTVARHVPVGVGGTVTNANEARVFIPTSGGVQLIFPIGASAAGCQGVYPLD